MAKEFFFITREIGIDAGHRVTYHGSKCRNLHGHRYTIQATCVGPLYKEGEQEGMVLDFGFLKDIMMTEIDYPCDHGMILWIDDPLVKDFVNESQFSLAKEIIKNEGCSEGLSKVGKLYLVPFVPTAENLAKHWYERLDPKVNEITNNQASLSHVKVWETPNCSAQYPTLPTIGIHETRLVPR